MSIKLYICGCFASTSTFEAFPKMEIAIFDHEPYCKDYTILKVIELDNEDIDQFIGGQQTVIRKELERRKQEQQQTDQELINLIGTVQ